MRILKCGGLLLQKLRWDEWLILTVYACLVAWPQVLVIVMAPKNTLDPSAQKVAGAFFSGFTVGTVMVAFSPGTRFRNVYFSAGWLGLSIWLLTKSNGPAIAPLVLFGLYHAVRGYFWYRYRRELIPASVNRNNYEPDFYRLENRYSASEDIRYTKFLFRVGMVLLFLTFLLTPV